MAYRASFSSKSSRSGLISSYGIEIFFCFLLCFFFLVSSYTQNNFFLKTKYYVIAFSEPGLKIISAPFDMIGKSFSSVTEIKEIKKKNTLLINENNLLKQQLNKSNFYEIENFRLKKLLNIDNKDYSKKITSRVLIDPYKSSDFIFFIDSGKNDGVKINDIVFNEFGIVGRISEVGKYSSKVLSIFSQDSVIPVISLNSKKSFFVVGGGEKLDLKHIEKPFELKHSEEIITTKAAGYFKEGIAIGKVVKTLNNVYVKPFAKISDSIYVNVLVFDFENIIE